MLQIELASVREAKRCNGAVSLDPTRGAVLVYSLVPPQAHTFTAAVVGVDELNSGKLQGALNRIAFDFSQHAGENGVGSVAIPCALRSLR
jgi:hypothetical protein